MTAFALGPDWAELALRRLLHHDTVVGVLIEFTRSMWIASRALDLFLRFAME
jgi:hypothetical protein